MPKSEIITLIAISVGFIGYAPYLYDMFKGKTKPHIFSWLIWALIEFIAFGIQIKSGIGVGSWVSFFSALIASIITIYAFQKRNKERKLDITISDYWCLFGALLSLILWIIFDQAISAAILISLTDFFAFMPTFRKTWHFPHEETLFEYAMAALKFLIAFFAFTNFTLAAIIYPAYLIIINTTFVIYALVLRKKIKNS